MGMALAKTMQLEEKEENNIIKFFKSGERVFIELIQNAEDINIKDCAIRLYQVHVKVFDDFYNVYYGRNREVWGKHLKKHILTLRKALIYMKSLGLLLATEIPNYVFAKDPLEIEDESVNFPMVQYLTYSLLYDLQTINTLYRIF